MDSIAAIAAALDDLSQEEYLLPPLPNRHIIIANAGVAVGKLGELVVVSREQGPGADARSVSQGLRNGPRDAQPVEGARAAADLI